MDAVTQLDNDWLLNIQRKLYQWSKGNIRKPHDDLWNWITDSRNLRLAFRRVATNKGSETPGIDKMTAKKIVEKIGTDVFIKNLREKLRAQAYEPAPVRRKLIPKPGKRGQYRGLGIPTIEDRVVQCAIKQIIEPIFEPRFLHVSNGFRPARAVRDAVELIRGVISARQKDDRGRWIKPPYQWVIEGDIKSCFDNIDHHQLMNRVRQSVADLKVNRLILKFLKAGVLAEENFFRTDSGTPQGGILSPLLANIALGVIEERYARWAAANKKNGEPSKAPRTLADQNRQKDRACGKSVFYPVRYADDFVILCSGAKENVLAEKEKLAEFLQKELGLQLSQEKTKVSSLSDGFDFLGHRIRQDWNTQWGVITRAFVPPEKKRHFRGRIRQLTRVNSLDKSLENLLQKLNPIIRGWGNFYRHTTRAHQTFESMDRFMFWRIYGWLEKKYPHSGKRAIYRRFRKRGGLRDAHSWADGELYCARMYEIKRGRWDPSQRKLPKYMFLD